MRKQALADLRARRLGVPVHILLGGKARDAVRVYANINRGARDRSVEGIALAARNAVAAGFRAVKIAPFDGVLSDSTDKSALDTRTQAGIDRVYGIREAVGPDIDILVDCHWRFHESGALELIRKLADGCFVVPDTPGLGIDLDDNVLRANPYRKLAPNANLDARLG